MIRIRDFLYIGKRHARTGRELAAVLHCPIRDISELVEKERRTGTPILASCDSRCPGYYLAETSEEVRNYCKGLHKRAGEIYKTRDALLKTADRMAAEEAAEAGRL